MQKRLSLIVLLMVALVSLLCSCSSIVYKQQFPQAKQNDAPRKWLIFLDGTNNDVASDTNVKRLHSLVSLQNNPNVGTLYVEGVGVGSDVIGMGMGGGFGKRVRLAYEFLLNNYSAGDKIYIFGFSRGAFEARALTSMLYYIGLPDLPPSKNDSQESVVEKQYEEMKDWFHKGETPQKIASARDTNSNNFLKSRDVTILGLWDSVEALGFPQWPRRIAHKLGIAPLHVDIDEANNRYGDQLFNVKHVLHAVSIDDDREWIFTPKLLTRCHLLKPKGWEASTDVPWNCDSTTQTPDILEVFFSGAHSDVGGGYTDSNLSGVSLNWMISMLQRIDSKDGEPSILPEVAKVREDPLGTSHDPEGGWSSGLYHNVNRNLAAYALGELIPPKLERDSAQITPPDQTHMPLPAFQNQLCMHPSVFQRRNAMTVKPHENHLLKLIEPGPICVAPKKKLANPPIFKELNVRPVNSVEDCKQDDARVINILEWNEVTGTCLPLKKASQ